VTTLGVMVTALAAVVGMVLVWLVQRLVLKVRER
jgi:ABC-type Fe3+ transport system permease subunit